MSIPGTHCRAVQLTCTPAWPTVQSPTDLSNLHINPLSKKTPTAATYATNTRNQHATSISEQQQTHRKANRHQQSTVDSKNSQNHAAREHACHTPEGATRFLDDLRHYMSHHRTTTTKLLKQLKNNYSVLWPEMMSIEDQSVDHVDDLCRFGSMMASFLGDWMMWDDYNWSNLFVMLQSSWHRLNELFLSADICMIHAWGDAVSCQITFTTCLWEPVIHGIVCCWVTLNVHSH